MAAAAVTVNAASYENDNTNYIIERVNVTAAATGDWYDCINIGTVVGATISPAYAIQAADAAGITWSTNRVTLSLIAGAAVGVFELVIWGTATP
jgi:hypothetical protein